MKIDQMRGDVSHAYPGEAWKARVSRMSDSQVIAVWHRFSETGKFDETSREMQRQPHFEQMRMSFMEV